MIYVSNYQHGHILKTCYWVGKKMGGGYFWFYRIYHIIKYFFCYYLKSMQHFLLLFLESPKSYKNNDYQKHRVSHRRVQTYKFGRKCTKNSKEEAGLCAGTGTTVTTASIGPF